MRRAARATMRVSPPRSGPNGWCRGGSWTATSERRDGAMDAAPISLMRLRLGVAAIWLLVSALLLAFAWGRIGSLQMWDPDDYMRLQQVRDWLGGQSFFDVAQYRIDPPR